MFYQASVSWFHSANDLTLAPSFGTYILLPGSWFCLRNSMDNLQTYYCIVVTPGAAWLQPGAFQMNHRSQSDSMKKTASTHEPRRRWCWYKPQVTRTWRKHYIFQRRGWSHPAKRTRVAFSQILLFASTENYWEYGWSFKFLTITLLINFRRTTKKIQS